MAFKLLNNVFVPFFMHLQDKSHKADEYIRIAKDNLPSAVEDCIEAAGYEFSTANQELFIRVRNFIACMSIT